MRVLALTLLLWTCFVSCAFGQVLKSVDFDVGDIETRAVLTFSVALEETPQFFAITKGDPRYVVDFKNVSAKLGGEKFKDGQYELSGKGAVKSLRYAKRGTTGLRLVFDLKAHTTSLDQSIDAKAIVLRFANTNGVQLASEDSQPAVDAKADEIHSKNNDFIEIPYPRLQPHPQGATKRKPIIVIDPGHGGYDPGAVGKEGTHEKTLTFKAAKELQKQLLKTGRYKIMLTRTKDVYVDHEERLRIARAGGADLFISIHADSAGNASARGASVYTLSDRSKNRSRKVVNTQNWVMDVDLTQQTDTVGNILVDLAQRNTFSQSANFADVLLPELGKSSHLVGNSHRRAGYFVLLAPDVPAVLLEMGFLSNSQDEKLLGTEKHRKKMMTAVTTAINTYFDNHNP